MNKKIVVVTIIITLFINISLVYAGNPTFDIGDAISGAEGFLSGGETEASGTNIDGSMSDVIKGLVSAGLGIGTIVAVCAGIVIAIKNMTDGAEGKKELKESLTPYIIGCVVLFGAFTIWSGAVQIMEDTIAPAGTGGGSGGGSAGGGSPLPGDPGTLLGANVTFSGEIGDILARGTAVSSNVYSFPKGSADATRLAALINMGTRGLSRENASGAEYDRNNYEYFKYEG